MKKRNIAISADLAIIAGSFSADFFASG